MSALLFDRRHSDRKKIQRKSPLDTARAELNKPSVEIPKLRQYLEPNELKKFFDFLPKTSFWYPYFFIQYFYGCRISEPALILDDDVKFPKTKRARGQITIHRLKKTEEDVYEADDRVLECVRVAQRWKEQKKIVENPFLFASNRQRSSSTVGAERLSQLRNLDGWQAVSRFTAHRMFQRIVTYLKLPEYLQHSHVLKHTRAILLLASGAAPEHVQILLGHNSLKMTYKYMTAAESMRSKLRGTELGL